MPVEASWNDRFFGSLPCGPGTPGILLALLLVVLILGASALFGDLLAFLDAEGSLWRSRDARIAGWSICSPIVKRSSA